MAAPDVAATSSDHRIEPRPSVAVAIVLLYVVVVFGLQLSTGIPYADWVSTPANGVRSAVVPLAVGSALLLGFLAVARWDLVWRDPGRLPMTKVMKVALWFFVASVLIRFAGVDWGQVSGSLLMVVIASGVLVGFAEETLFRGIFLRALRTGGRTEGVAALWTAVAFGLFHLPNLIVGTGPGQLVQVVLAAVSGAILYAFRRNRGLLLTAMIAHGTFDMSAFLSAGHAQDWLGPASLLLVLGGLVLGVLVLVSVWRTDRTTVVTPGGIERRAPDGDR
jgi:membrane protease YdiL (CAAX protease family)